MEYHIERVKVADEYVEIRYPLRRILYRGRSRFQEIIVAESGFGKMLILDGVLQLTTYDEWIYHKALTLPPFKDSFRKVLILGGGDGGAARTLISEYPHIIIDIVDIDPMVTEIVNRYMPEVSSGVFNKDNVNLISDDAYHYVETCDNTYDYILGDLTDLRYEFEKGSEVNRLYSLEFISKVKRILGRDGVVTYHIGGFNMDRGFIMDTYRAFIKSFKHVEVYSVYVPSFLDLWTFISASDSPIKLRDVGLEIHVFTDYIRKAI